MSETSLAGLAVQRVTYAALHGALTDPVTSAVVPVVDQPTETSAFPYVELTTFIETGRDTFNHTGRSVLATIDVWSRSGPDAAQDGWGQARQIAGQIDVLLHASVHAPSDGWTFVSYLLDTTQDRPLSDGITRAVTLEYRVLLETTT